MKLFLLLIIFVQNINPSDSNYISNIKGEMFIFNEIKKNTNFIIFLNNFNCYNCLFEIKQELNSIQDSNFAIILRTNNSIISKKRLLSFANKIYKTSNIYFDVYEGENELATLGYKKGLFGYYKIKSTPTLLVNICEFEKYYHYDYLFNENRDLDSLFKTFPKCN